MDARLRKMLGLGLVAVGAVVALVGLLADALGIGAEGADGLGTRQVAMLVAGLVIAGIGVALAFLVKDRETAGAVEASE